MATLPSLRSVTLFLNQTGLRRWLSGHAQILQAALRLPEAAAAFRSLMNRIPGESMRRNLEVCERVMRDNPGPSEPDIVGLRAIHQVMTSEGRIAQAAPIGTKLGLGRADIDRLLTARMELWRKLAGWDRLPESQRLKRYGDGSLVLSLDQIAISDLSSLKGLPIIELNLNWTAVTDLTPLAGMRLTGLSMSGAPIADLSPLRDIPLRRLDLWQCRKISNLEPLIGMPLEELNIGQTSVTDYSPLRGSGIKSLMMECLAPTNLNMLIGLPLERLTALACARLTDISALRQMPRMRWLEIGRCEAITDFSPLATCTNLELLTIPRSFGRQEFLRHMPRLRAIGYEMNAGLRPAPEFLLKQWPEDPQVMRASALVRRARTALATAGSPELRAEQVHAQEDGTLDIRFMYRRGYTNLNPLAGLPISMLDISGTGITDLSALRGMPLRYLDMHETEVVDLSPLSDSQQLKELYIWKTRVRDLKPLRNLPLEIMLAGGAPIDDASPLAGLPLRRLSLENTLVRDLAPLLKCRDLRELVIPANAQNLSALRALDKLTHLATRWQGAIDGRPAQDAETFWREFDSKSAAGR